MTGTATALGPRERAGVGGAGWGGMTVRQDPPARSPTGHRVVALCGNPRANSRTRGLAVHVAGRIAGTAGLGPAAVSTVDLLDYGPRLFDRTADDVRALVGDVAAADLVVVASPVFKGSYTGLLKAFLDQFPQAGLAGTMAVPLMVGSLARHADVPDRLLGPLLAELGADVLPGLFVPEDDLADAAPRVEAWLGGDLRHRLVAGILRCSGRS